MLSLEQRLDKVEGIIKKPSFRQNKGLGNEVGYYIFDYPAEQELAIREYVEYIRQKNEEAIDGFRIVVFDLYDILISILKDKGYLEKCFEFEKTKGFDRITKAVGNMLRITSSDSLIVNYIRERTPANSVVFITGIGKCYPILRSHTVLNNLHQVIDHVPVVMFYPGKYDGQELVLFGEIKDDRFALTTEKIQAAGVTSLPLASITGEEDGRTVYFPLGSDLFKAAGAGLNYVHGGSSPQELIVPLIDVKTEKGRRDTTTAQIALVSLTSKITNLITTLDFIQTEPVSDVVKETTYRLYFISDDNEKISNENIYIADKKDKDTTKRVFRLRFSFKNKKYDRSRKYYLVAFDDKNDLEVLRHEIIMDIAFADDFGFGF